MIGSDYVGLTSLGTGTTKTLLGGADLVLPAWARSILAVRPTLVTETPVADEAVMASLTIESDDVPIQPFITLANPISGVDAAAGGAFTGEPPWYPVNCPVNGGDRLKIYGTSLNAITTGGFMGCQVVMSDRKVASRKHAKIGAITSTGTTTSVNVNEASYTLTGGKRITELLGFAAVMTVAATDTLAGRFEFLSNDFKDPTPLKLPVNPICGGISATIIGTMTPGLSRAKVDIGILSPCQLTNNINLAIAPAAAGQFITGVIYE
ncbi:MAG: hypothetical protein H8D26_03180 [Methanomicrobia archaeon]|nr:hypothetical protein [Methanomicrobia archaeon]